MITKLIFLLIVLLPSLAGAEVRIVATLADYGAIAREVGGDRVKVDVLAPHSVDPHYVDPRPNLILKLNKADLLIENGLELESAWLDPLVAQARNDKINPGSSGRFVAARYARLIEVPDGKVDRAEGDVHPGGNPHFYCDPTSAIAISNALAAQLGKIDPDGATTYEANAKTFTQKLWKFARAQAVRFARLPVRDRKVITYHKSLGYLLRWLQIEEVTTVEPKPGIPPNPKHVAKVLATMKAEGARIIVQEEFYPRKTSETLAKLGKGNVVVLPAASDFGGGEDYLTHLNELTEALYAALTR